MLRFTSVNLILISDVEKYQSFESTIMGCISMIFKGYAEANNELSNSHNASTATSYILYFNANNLHGHSIMQLLPIETHDWVNPKDFNLDD